MLQPVVPFSVELRPARSVLVVRVCGEIDLFTAPKVRELVTEAVSDGWDSIVVDFRPVTFMDSAGVHLLSELKGLDQQGVSCRMIDGSPAVRDVLTLVGAHGLLPSADPALL